MQDGTYTTPACLKNGNPGTYWMGLAQYPNYFDADQLYDLEKDPLEQNNLACDPDCQEVLNDMKSRLKKYIQSHRNHYPLEPHPFQQSKSYRTMCAEKMATEPFPHWRSQELKPRA